MLVLAQSTEYVDVYHVLRPLLGYIVAGANVVECKNSHIYGFYKTPVSGCVTTASAAASISM